MVKRKQVGKSEAGQAVVHDPKQSSVSYSALIFKAFDPVHTPIAWLTAVTPAMRITDAARDVAHTARLAAQRFAGWPDDSVRRSNFFAVFDGQRSSLPHEERARRLARLADEVAGHSTVQNADGFAQPNFVTAGEQGDDPATMTELPPGCIAALLAVRRAPSLIMLSAALGFGQTVNLGVYLHAAAIAYHAVYLGLAIDPGAVAEKLALAAGAQRIVANWAFVHVRLNGVPTYAIGLQSRGSAVS
jgi:hypothetical protein